MRIYSWDGKIPNFGDRLNEWLWDWALAGYRDVAPDTWLVGIGTVLTTKMPRGPRILIVGSGVGYGRLPPPEEARRWDVRALRGPLSARALGVPPSRAITDPAVLTSDVPAFAGIVPDIDIAFVPHWESAVFGRWQEAAELAGLHYIDPRRPSQEVVAEIARCRHVLAESMHAAIIADTFGRTWRPITTSGRILAFKWVDWCRSMEVEYEPVPVPQTTVAERLFKGEFRQSAVVAEALAADNLFRTWQRLQAVPAPGRSTDMARRLRIRIAKALNEPTVRRRTARLEHRWLEVAAAALAEAKTLPGRCSTPTVRLARKQAYYHIFAEIRADYFPAEVALER